MSNFITERDGSGTITISPKQEADQSALVVICHGLGDTAEGFSDVAEVRALFEKKTVAYIFCSIGRHSNALCSVSLLFFFLLLFVAFGTTNALHEIYFTNGSNATGNHEYGDANAVLV